MTTIFVIALTSGAALGLGAFNSRAVVPREHLYRWLLLRSLLSIALLVALWVSLGTVLTISDGAPMLVMLQAIAANAPLFGKKLDRSRPAT